MLRHHSAPAHSGPPHVPPSPPCRRSPRRRSRRADAPPPGCPPGRRGRPAPAAGGTPRRHPPRPRPSGPEHSGGLPGPPPGDPACRSDRAQTPASTGLPGPSGTAETPSRTSGRGPKLSGTLLDSGPPGPPGRGSLPGCPGGGPVRGLPGHPTPWAASEPQRPMRNHHGPPTQDPRCPRRGSRTARSRNAGDRRTPEPPHTHAATRARGAGAESGPGEGEGPPGAGVPTVEPAVEGAAAPTPGREPTGHRGRGG